MPVEPLPFQPPNAWMPGQAPVVAPARRFTYGDAGLDAVEELLDLGRVLAVDAGGQAVDGVVGQRDRLIDRVHRGHRGERREQLVLEQPVRGGQTDDRRLHVEPALHAVIGQPLATDEDGAVAARLGDRGLVPIDGLLVDDRAQPVGPQRADRRR